MKLTRERILLIAMCGLVSLLMPGNYGQSKGEARSSTLSAQERNEAEWGFWHITTGKHLADELFHTKKECKEAEKSWSKSSGVGPIAFRCARVDNKLLDKANARCKRKESYACEWADSIQAILKRQAAP